MVIAKELEQQPGFVDVYRLELGQWESARNTD